MSLASRGSLEGKRRRNTRVKYMHVYLTERGKGDAGKALEPAHAARAKRSPP